MIRRAKIAPRAPSDPAVAAYLRSGRYPIKGQSKHFSWAVWERPERERTPASEAERAVAYISSLTHSKGPSAGRPFRLRTWQDHGIVRRLFGTLDAEGYRQYRQAFIFLPTRSGKTELAAASMIYLLHGDGEPGAELFSVACDVDQAALVFNVAAQMVRNDPELAARLEVVASRRRILHPASNSVWRVIASDAPSALGVNASGITLDELAAWPQRDIYDVMSSRTGSRRAPLTIIITTAGSDEHGVGKEAYDYAVKVRDGLVPDDTLLPVIYEAAADADPGTRRRGGRATPPSATSARCRSSARQPPTRRRSRVARRASAGCT
jgi:phage terminase large subunit-like protein